MGPDRLDRFIKDKVFDHQTATDTDALWEGILAKQAINKRPQRRFAWWWFMAGLVLVISTASYVLFSQKEINNNTISNEINLAKTESNEEQEPKSPNKSTVNNNTNTSLLSKEEKAISANKNTTEEESLSATATNNIERKPITSTTGTPSKQTATGVEKVNDINFLQSTTVDDNLNVISTKIEATKPKMAFNEKIVIANENKNKLKPNQHSGHPDNNTLSKQQTKDQNSFTDKNQDSSFTRAIHSGSPNPFKKESPNIITTSIILQSLLAQIENDSPLALSSPSENLPKPPSETKPQKKASPFSIGVSFGYGFAKKQLKTKSDDAAAYLQMRKESETAMQALNAGIDLTYQFQSGLYAKSGLQYEQITERFDYNRTTETSFFNDTATVALYYNIDGSVEKEFGTESMELRTQTRKIYNRYRTIDIPLSIGYQPTTIKKLNWFVEGGVLVNLGFMPRGEILDYNGEDQIDLSSTSYFKNNLGLSLTAGAGLSYRLTKHWSVWMSPKIRVPLMDMTDEVYILEQRFLRGVVEIGGRFSL